MGFCQIKKKTCISENTIQGDLREFWERAGIVLTDAGRVSWRDAFA